MGTPVDLLAKLRFLSSEIFGSVNGMPKSAYDGLSKKKRRLLDEFMSEIHQELLRPMLLESDPGVGERAGSLLVTAGKFYEVFSVIPERAFLAFSGDKQRRLVDALGEAHRLTRFTD